MNVGTASTQTATSPVDDSSATKDTAATATSSPPSRSTTTPTPPAPEATAAEETTTAAASTTAWEQARDDAKQAGDGAYRSQDFRTAIRHYSTALSLDPDHAALLSNRSAAYLAVGDTSRAYHDARTCVRLGTLGSKAWSRLAAAQQGLRRYADALVSWQQVQQLQPDNVAAQTGIEGCTRALAEQQQLLHQPTDLSPPNGDDHVHDTANGDDHHHPPSEEDDLEDFFNDVDEATTQVVQDKVRQAEIDDQGVPTDHIKTHRQELGSVQSQIERLLQPNYPWRNLNPFYVLDITHDAPSEDVSRRYKALSLLLHPDKNRNHPNVDRVQQAYDEVLKAKSILDDEHKSNHCRQLAEQGMKQGKVEYERQRRGKFESDLLRDYQQKAIHRIFAQIEQQRREVEKRERSYAERERANEEDTLQKERASRQFDKSWRQTDRVDKRIGNWRDFATDKKAKR